MWRVFASFSVLRTKSSQTVEHATSAIVGLQVRKWTKRIEEALIALIIQAALKSRTRKYGQGNRRMEYNHRKQTRDVEGPEQRAGDCQRNRRLLAELQPWKAACCELRAQQQATSLNTSNDPTFGSNCQRRIRSPWALGKRPCHKLRYDAGVAA